MRPKSTQACLLYAPDLDVPGRLDPVALARLVSATGLTVEQVSGQPGRDLTVRATGVRIDIEFQERPLPMSLFRGRMRPPETEAARQGILRRLASHGANVQVAVLDGSPRSPITAGLKQRLVWEIVDHLMTLATPEIVLCPGREWLMTADEAEDWLSSVVERAPRTPSRAMTGRHDMFLAEPALSDEAVAWFGASAKPSVQPANAVFSEERMAAALRSFLTHRGHSGATGVPDTPAGRSALYVMSATVMCFALPLGAMALTYNALSGGSLRLTAYTMAGTGLGTIFDPAIIPRAAATFLGIG